MLTVRFELELGRVRERNALLAAAVHEYKLRVKNLKKKVEKEKPNKMTLQQELEHSHSELDLLDYDRLL